MMEIYQLNLNLIKESWYYTKFDSKISGFLRIRNFEKDDMKNDFLHLFIK